MQDVCVEACFSEPVQVVEVPLPFSLSLRSPVKRSGSPAPCMPALHVQEPSGALSDEVENGVTEFPDFSFLSEQTFCESSNVYPKFTTQGAPVSFSEFVLSGSQKSQVTPGTPAGSVDVQDTQPAAESDSVVSPGPHNVPEINFTDGEDHSSHSVGVTLELFTVGGVKSSYAQEVGSPNLSQVPKVDAPKGFTLEEKSATVF